MKVKELIKQLTMASDGLVAPEEAKDVEVLVVTLDDGEHRVSVVGYDDVTGVIKIIVL